MSIQSELNRLGAAKASLKNAINSKGGNLTNESISQYAAAVSALDIGGSGTSGGINPFSVAYGLTLPSEVVQNQIFVITDQTPTVVLSYNNNNIGIEIGIRYTEDTGESIEDLAYAPGGMWIEFVGDPENSIKVNLGNGIVFNTGIAAPDADGTVDNCVALLDDIGYAFSLDAYFGHDDAWIKISNYYYGSGYSLRRARRT